jgi:hypothetical protein
VPAAKKAPKESSSFKIDNNGVQVSFRCEGSVVGGIVEASTWMPPDRRQRLIERLQVKHQELLEKEARRAAAA